MDKIDYKEIIKELLEQKTDPENIGTFVDKIIKSQYHVLKIDMLEITKKNKKIHEEVRNYFRIGEDAQ